MTALETSQDLRQKLVDQYFALCDQRDAAYKRAAPFEEKLREAIAATRKAQALEMELAAKVEKAWGAEHLALKKEIASIARSLGKIPPRK